MRTRTLLGILGLSLGAATGATAAGAEDQKNHKKPQKQAVASSKPAKTQVASAKQTAAPAPMKASELVADDDKLAASDKVHTGRMVCELGNAVTVTADPQAPGNFVLQMRQHTYHMTPVVSATGAVRLEDAKAGAMWLQLANKSMLMNSKLGQRMADECQSPAQMAVAEAMKSAPPPSLLDDPAVARK